MHGVSDAIVNRRTAAVGEKSSIQIESDPSIAIANGGDLLISDVTLTVGQERCGIRMRSNDARRRVRAQIIKRGA